MPEREFELYLNLLGKLLKLSPEQKASISDELRDHLEERFEELVQSGQSRDDAIQQALDEFGDAAGLAVDFTKVSRKKIRRAIVRTTAISSAVVALAAFLFVNFGPVPGGNDGPGGTSIVNADPGDKPPSEPVVNYLADEELFPEVAKARSFVDFTDAPLSDVFQYLSELHNVPILVDQTALEDAGIPSDEPITLKTEGLPRAWFSRKTKESGTQKPAVLYEPTLAHVLTWIGHPFQLTWYADDGIIHVTTKDMADERLIPRNYDIRHLLKSGFESQTLTDLVMSGDAYWEDTDGNGGSLALIGSVLTVRQTWHGHRQIARLLASLSTPTRHSHQYVSGHGIHLHLLNQLQRKVTVEFLDAPMSEVVHFFEQTQDIDIHVDLVAFDDAGIPLDEPINLNLKNVSLAKAAEVAFGSLHLKLVPIDGRLTLTTTDVANDALIPVLYDVSDVYSESELKRLVSAFETTTDGQWDRIDGIGGAGHVVGHSGLLLIYQTQQVHSQIQKIINWTRKTPRGDKPIETAQADHSRLETRFYHMDRDTAEDLLTLVPEMIEPNSWKSPLNPVGGFISKVAAGRRILQIQGQALSGQGQIGGLGAQGKASDKKPPQKATNAKAPQVKTSVVIPEAVLVIRQTAQVHRKIEKFLTGLQVELKITDENGGTIGNGQGQMGGGGSFF